MTPSECLLSKPYQPPYHLGMPVGVREVWQEGHPSFVPFRVGQLVLYRKPRTGPVKTAKLKPLYEGPHEVREIRQNGIYLRHRKEN